MRTPVEALKELRDRLSYFCARLDGKYDPPWAQELVGIIDDALAQDAHTPLNMAECRSALEAIADSAKTGSISSLPSASLVLKTCEKALAAKPRVCDVYPSEGLKTVIITEMAKRCAAGLYSPDDLEMVKAVSDSVIDGVYSEMKEA
jgi:hypothetical protein